ncbi:PepSY-associated TM helix domain-containing protein [Frigidibacter oleivorans]
MLFALTGLGILWAHAKNRPSTWPLTGLGLAAPVILILLVAHV